MPITAMEKLLARIDRLDKQIRNELFKTNGEVTQHIRQLSDQLMRAYDEYDRRRFMTRGISYYLNM